jgi:hypothetical protein
MKYKEIHDEYFSLLSQWSECMEISSSSKEGYISTKTISGKKYAYLQKLIDGKINSEYIQTEMLPQVQAELRRRDEAKKEIKHINEQLSRLETAAKVLDKSLHYKLTVLRRCALMDSMPVDTRKKSLAFGNAMAAIEGLPTSNETDESMSLWATGQHSFKDGYMKVLAKYNLIEV